MMIISGLFLFLCLTTNVSAQNAPSGEYFSGKWNILTEGTPSGDANSLLIIERNEEGKLGGVFQSEGGKPAKLTRVEETEESITAYFIASGYDVYLWLEKVDDDTVEGTMMDMFDAYGTRVKDE